MEFPELMRNGVTAIDQQIATGPLKNLGVVRQGLINSFADTNKLDFHNRNSSFIISSIVGSNEFGFAGTALIDAHAAIILSALLVQSFRIRFDRGVMQNAFVALWTLK